MGAIQKLRHAPSGQRRKSQRDRVWNKGRGGGSVVTSRAVLEVNQFSKLC